MSTGREKLIEMQEQIDYIVVSISYSNEQGKGFVDMVALEKVEDIDKLIAALTKKDDVVILESRIRTEYDPKDVTMVYTIRKEMKVDEVTIKSYMKG